MTATAKFRDLGIVVAVIALGGGCGSSNSSPTNPTPPPPPATVTLAAPVPLSPKGGVEITGVRPRLEVTNSVATGNPGAVTYRFEVSSDSSFPADGRTLVMNNVAQGPTTTGVEISTDLTPATVYHWRAQATNGTVTSSFSTAESLKTEVRGIRNGQTIFDPLTNGTTVADERHGGHFVIGPNGGWQSDSRTDSLDYNIPACASCQVEFDATNFNSTTPGQTDIEPKWFSMGDASKFNDFTAFRDDPWKMHLEIRADVPGAVKLIWRRGCNTTEACDNMHNPRIAMNWSASKVYHFTLAWGGGNMSVNICEYNGASCVATMYTGTGTGPYNPSNHRVEIGTRPRGESLIGAIYRNVRIGPR